MPRDKMSRNVRNSTMTNSQNQNALVDDLTRRRKVGCLKLELIPQVTSSKFYTHLLPKKPPSNLSLIGAVPLPSSMAGECPPPRDCLYSLALWGPLIPNFDQFRPLDPLLIL